MNYLARYFPAAVVVLAAAYLIAKAIPPAVPPAQMQFQEFGKLPIKADGRVKPIDTLARNSLLVLNHRQDYVDGDKTHTAVEWLLDVWTQKGATDAAKRKVIRIEDAEIRATLKLPENKEFAYSLDDIEPNMRVLIAEVLPLRQVPSKSLTEKQRSKLELVKKVLAYAEFAQYGRPQKVFRIENIEVLSLLGLEPREGFRYSFDEILPRIYDLHKQSEHAQSIAEDRRTVYDSKVLELGEHVKIFTDLQLTNPQLLVVAPSADQESWRSLEDGIKNAEKDGSAQYLIKVLRNYHKGNAASFNADIKKYQAWLAAERPAEYKNCQFESYFNFLAPFSKCAMLYVGVFLLTCLGWISGWGPFNRAALWLTAFVLLVQTVALCVRMDIEGRPPVTNLYSSAVFIGWGSVVTGLILEVIFKNSIGNVVAGTAGSLTLLIAHHLAQSGDTIKNMEPVLNTNFWLATHVTCVTIGYTATLVAGIIGIAFVVKGVFTSALDRDELKSLGQMLYGVVCFAMLFSFVGTVLGGIWADQSWGRFWGWDPKENGALLIVLMNAIILHARWGGIVKQRGMAVMAICGNMVTGWSWFGTNQLQAGLHSYGFNDTLAKGLVIAWTIHLVLIGIGLIPLRYWRSAAAFGIATKPRPPKEPDLLEVQPA